MNSFLFLYKGNKINFDLIFEEQSKNQCSKNNEMKILVYKNNKGTIIYSKNKLTTELNNQKINDIISRNNKIKTIVNEVKTNIGIMNIMNNNFLVNSMNIQFETIKKVLNNIQEDIQINNEKLKHFIKDDNNMRNNNYKINNKNLSLTDEKPLENVKSKYILKIEKRKLKLIKYNKNLQNKKDIEITHYQFFVEDISYMKRVEKEKNIILKVV